MEIGAGERDLNKGEPYEIPLQDLADILDFPLAAIHEGLWDGPDQHAEQYQTTIEPLH